MSEKLLHYATLAADAIKGQIHQLKSELFSERPANDCSSNSFSNADEDNILICGERNEHSTTLCCDEISTENINSSAYKTQLPKCLPFQPGFEKLDHLPTKMSMRQIRKQRQKERSLTKGKGWFDMPATEQTEERLNDLKVIQMRSVLDPKRFYKNTDIRPGVLPKYFQTGTIIETAADFYSSRIPKKQRKKTLLDELTSDAEFQRYKKRKYAEVVSKMQDAPRRKKKRS